jgi:hypothetical protein
VVQLGVGGAPLGARGGEGEKRVVSARELVDGRAMLHGS